MKALPIAPGQVWEHTATGKRVTVDRVKPEVRDVVTKTPEGRVKYLSMVTLRGNYKLVKLAEEPRS